MSSKVLITGIGPISCVGNNVDEFWKSMVQGKVGYRSIPSVSPNTKCTVASTLPEFNLRNYIQDERILLLLEHARAPQFALASCLQAVKDSGIDLKRERKDRVGLFVGTSGNFDALFSLGNNTEKLTSYSMFATHTGSTASLISSILDIHGPADTLSSGCPSGLDSVGVASHMIKTGIIDVAIVVGSDAEVVSQVYEGFEASKALNTESNEKPSASRPFDKDRNGIIAGEGACAVVLESKDHFVKREKRGKVYAAVSAYAKASAGARVYDAFAPSSETSASIRAIKTVLDRAGWNTKDVDVFCANGSGSKMYDKIECNAIASAFSDTPTLKVNSIKGMTGQTGAGCTVLQVAASALSLANQTIVGTVNFETPDPDIPPLNIIKRSEQSSVRKIVCQAIGLGGFQYSCLALEYFDDKQTHSRL